MKTLSIKELMAQSGVAFGTSGARGLVTAMTDEVCLAYTTAFLKHVEESGQIAPADRELFVAGDRRPSSPRIMRAVAQAASDRGYTVRSAGLVPSPALALFGMRRGMPAVMVTGSHIPDDRNGLKFTTRHGEITKADEAGVAKQSVTLLSPVDEKGMLVSPRELPETDATAVELYIRRYVDAFGQNALSGHRLGVYGHSAVGRDLLVELYQALGAEVVSLGWSESFIPVDTEAIRPEDDVLAADWAQNDSFSALVSTDGDSDRPLLSDERGRWLRGDITGILTAHFLGADAVALPVSCNTALEKSSWFKHVKRTRIGSPFVIAGLTELNAAGAKAVVGYEANGGFFTQTSLSIRHSEGHMTTLPALPTRDPVIVHIAVLLLAKQHQCAVSELQRLLPQRITASGRDQNFSQARSLLVLSQLAELKQPELSVKLGLGPVISVDRTDGLRFTFETDEVLHLRPSGNAPELRCYAEADDAARAQTLVNYGLTLADALAPQDD